MRFQPAALIATSTIAIAASVFAIWPVVTDAPWEDEAAVVAAPTAPPPPTVSRAAFSTSDVLHVVQAEVATRGSFSPGMAWIRCVSATYRPANGKWVVSCDFSSERGGPSDLSRSYVFDDATGHLVD